MPKANNPDPDRRQTRATNATAHPGNVVKDVLAVRRKKEDIAEEKEGKNQRRKARERKKADAQVAIKHIADFENEMAIDDRAEETKFPRHQTAGIVARNELPKRRKGQATGSPSNTIRHTAHAKKTSSKTHKRRAADSGLDTGVNTEVEDNRRRLKKQKMATGHAEIPSPQEIDDDTPKGRKGHTRHVVDPESDTGFNTDVDELDDNQHHATIPANVLRRTETYIPHDFVEINDDTPKGRKGRTTRVADPESDTDTGFNTDVDKLDDNQHHAAIPANVLRRTETYIPYDFVEIDDDTPKGRKGQTRRVANSKIDTDVEELDNNQHHAANVLRRTETYIPHDFVEIHDDTPKRKPNLRRRIVESSEDDEDSRIEYETPRALRSKVSVSFSVDGSDDAGTKEDRNDGSGYRSADRWMQEDHEHKKAKATKVANQMIDLRKVQKSSTGSKDRRAFRKEVEDRRVVVAKSNKKDTVVSKHNVPPSGHAHAKSRTDNIDGKSRGSATSGNGIGIHRHTSGKAIVNAGGKATVNTDGKATMNTGGKAAVNTSGEGTVNTRSKTTTTDPVVNLSDEDDSVERESIIRSPPKGTQRLSSGTIVKVEAGASAEAQTRSRSKKKILSPDVFSGWTRFVEPNFVYFYFYELSPWPTTREIESCVQVLWDWRFGEAHCLDIAKSPPHIQLVTQKLCDIRNQTATAAIMNLDREFRTYLAAEFGNAGFAKSAEAITELRQKHAENLYEDKKFIFGKYVVTQDDQVRKSQPYQSGLFLRTFASFFKQIKDVDLSPKHDENTDGPSPSSRHPKTLLAITAAAIERALELTMNGNYNFDTNKLIPKADPGHLMQKLTTTMFAFSETIWQPRAEFYLEKSIAMM